MSRADYAAAAVSGQAQILGLRLRPLSLGHIILLKGCDCAFVADGERPATIEDLILGLVICSQTYEDASDFLEALDDPPPWWSRLNRSQRVLRKWGNRVRSAVRRDKEFSIYERFAMFQRHIASGSSMPRFWILKESSEQSSAPWYQNVKLALMSQLGYSETQALNMPLQVAFQDYFRHAEASGTIRLYSDAENELEDKMEVVRG
jgi:hypothetical protein